MEWVVETNLVAANLQIKMQHGPSNKYPCKEPQLSFFKTNKADMACGVIKRDKSHGQGNVEIYVEQRHILKTHLQFEKDVMV